MKTILFFLIALALSCSTNQEEGFIHFYEQFHSNEQYQLERIVFPLEGLPPFADTIETYYWQREDWVIHKPFNNSEFKQEFIYIDKTVVVEQFRSEELGMSRTFAKFNSKWYLIQYNAINYYD